MNESCCEQSRDVSIGNLVKAMTQYMIYVFEASETVSPEATKQGGYAFIYSKLANRFETGMNEDLTICLMASLKKAGYFCVPENNNLVVTRIPQ